MNDVTRQKPLVPGSVPFLSRPADFLILLQSARLQWLKDCQASKRRTKRIDKAVSSGEEQSRKKGASRTKKKKIDPNEVLALMIKEALQKKEQ